MLDKSSESSTSKLTLVQPTPSSPISLKELAAEDKDVMEFFRLIHEHDMRERALELIEQRIGRNSSN